MIVMFVTSVSIAEITAKVVVYSKRYGIRLLPTHLFLLHGPKMIQIACGLETIEGRDIGQNVLRVGQLFHRARPKCPLLYRVTFWHGNWRRVGERKNRAAQPTGRAVRFGNVQNECLTLKKNV